ncbi:restriction endonuclease subunit S [Clostridium algidicarnis]|uniref:Restriction endonuclease subunit S n=1 Tax=Clostridium algidicarnis TaxID=37659 RepID=A0ABS6C396_9CLOT|nr:restriction endonuclease subunit S [Clostridium algidicarnis]MBU3219964.1 restriction endonuclease subunit S [Clostridium algidicarnis]
MEHRLSLNDVEWKEFFIGGNEGIFEIESTSSGIDKNKLNHEGGKVPYITRSDINNGINMFISDNQNLKYNQDDGNVITIGLDTQTVFYQQNGFYTGQNIQVLSCETLSKEVAMFIIPLLKIQMQKFNWGGNGATLTRLKRTRILLPIDKYDNPSWQFMENYIKQEQKDIAQKVIDYYEQKIIETGFDLVGLEDVEWKSFYFDEIFRKIQRGKRLKKADHIDGKTPYVSSTSLNNGVDGFIGNEDKVRKFEGNLTLANSGSVGSCFYQDYEYIASDHVTSLTLENADKYIYLFMSTIIKRLEDKYSFNREINDKRIRREKIILPIDKFGKPNWDYMSKFMQKIEAEKLDKALEYIYIYIYKLAISEELKLPLFEEKEWKEFWLEGLVEINSGKDIYARERIDGKTPYVTATASNNGVGYFVDNTNKTLEEKCISVNRNGSVGFSFYHPYKALYGNDTRKLRPRVENKWVSLFLSKSISNQKEKYGYGYKMGTGRLKRQKVMLPISETGKVDYTYMKKYMQIQEIKKQYKIINYYKNLIEELSSF